ncbi:DUF2283 domain-containing protein [Thermotoga sp.]|uniref:DUF2283 domain-containing protein n=1 Tax=Thermotoga sp. TaxID=28240 RepID=UPI0025CC3E2C|nr:DUF2283 domain-containing protein [Thermotoga sp.]MCD6552203.1 DUF2283 domain-containing protein [Thermotoga sp.]
MKIRYSKEADALYIRFNDREIDSSDEILEDVIVDFDKDGNIVAIEILSASEKADIKEILIQAFDRVQVETPTS